MSTEQTTTPDVETRLENLRKALGFWVGAHTKEELDWIESVTLNMIGTEEDKAPLLNSIQILKDEHKYKNEKSAVNRFPYRMPSGTAEAIVSRSIALLEATPAGKKALAHMLEGFLDYGQEVANHVFPDKRGDQAEAFCDMVVVAITYGCTEEAFNQIKAHIRGQ